MEIGCGYASEIVKIKNKSFPLFKKIIFEIIVIPEILKYGKNKMENMPWLLGVK